MRSPLKYLALLVLVLFVAPCSFAMIATLKLPDLVRQAEFILIAKVVKISEIAMDKSQISSMKNVLIPEKVLKGDWNPQEPVVLMTKQCGKPGQIGWIEDLVVVPPVGSKVVLFLRKADDGSLETVNTVQGLWPMHEEKPEGMGFGITFDQIQELVKQQKY